MSFFNQLSRFAQHFDEDGPGKLRTTQGDCVTASPDTGVRAGSELDRDAKDAFVAAAVAFKGRLVSTAPAKADRLT
jgi:hypothetical protein